MSDPWRISKNKRGTRKSLKFEKRLSSSYEIRHSSGSFKEERRGEKRKAEEKSRRGKIKRKKNKLLRERPVPRNHYESIQSPAVSRFLRRLRFHDLESISRNCPKSDYGERSYENVARTLKRTREHTWSRERDRYLESIASLDSGKFRDISAKVSIP